MDFARIRALNDFRVLQVITGLRLPCSVRTYRLVVRLVFVGAALIGAPLLGLALVVVRTSIRNEPGKLAALTTLGITAVTYGCAAYTYRAVSGERRFAISNNPNAALFRALDITVVQVLLVYAVRGALFSFAGIALIGGLFANVVAGPIGIGVLGTVAVSAIPVCWWLATVGLAAHFAARPAVRRPRAGSIVLVGLLCGLGIGYVTTRVIIGPLVASGLSLAFTPVSAREIVWALVALSGAAGLIGLGLVTRTLPTLRRRSFPVGQVGTAGPSRPAMTGDRILARLGILGILYREWCHTWAFTVALRSLAVLVTVLAAVIGARWAGASFLPMSLSSLTDWTGRRDRTAVVIPALTAALALGIAGVAQGRVGPRAYAPQLRFAWENGCSARYLALSVLGLFLLPMLPLGALMVLLTGVLFGRLDLLPLAVAFGVAASSLISEFLSSPPSNTDGSTVADDTLSTLLFLAISAPTMLLIFRELDLPIVLYTVLLMGVALKCVAHRIVRRPSNSWTSPWDIDEEPPSSTVSA